MQRGLTLVELIIILGLFLGMGAGVWYFINPLEFSRRERDSLRLADLAILTQSVNRASQEASVSATKVLCPGGNPCQGKSDENSGDIRNINGKGWVRVDLSTQKGLQLPLLPTDPLNYAGYVYEFKSDGEGWEVNAKFESEVYRSKMSQDGGDNNDKYEVGTNLTIIN